MSGNHVAKPYPLSELVSPDLCVTHEGSLMAVFTVVYANGSFGEWVSRVEAEARRVLDRPTGDIAWLIGGPADMQASFDDGDSPAEYVMAQIENID